MIKKGLPLLLAVTLLLTGCRLAKPEPSGEVADGDRLVGVYATREYVDLFDFDSFLRDQLGNITGGELTPEDTAGYEGRVYGERIRESLPDSDGYHYRYEFPELEGFLLAQFRFEDENGAYTATSAGDGICDVHSAVSNTENSLTGTLYMEAGAGTVTLYYNPVYQTPDGQVYLLSGTGLSLSSLGEASQTLSETYTVTEDGETWERSFRVELKLDQADPADTVTVHRMDRDNRILTSETFPAEELPETYEPGKGTAYLLIEQRGKTLDRQLHEPGDGALTVFLPGEDGLCQVRQLQILWPE